MTASESDLFRPLRIGALELPGRVFKAATSETRADEKGFVTDSLLEFYEPIARAGTPLIITGNLWIHRLGNSTPRQCGVDDDDKIPGLRRWTDLAHRHGCRIFAQINHCGRQVVPSAVGLDYALSASDVKEPVVGTKPRAMTLDEIADVVDQFAAAAERCKRAGFDGIQLHGAHGYLINQFLTPHTNRRRDAYGGSPEKRMRLLVEVFRACRERTGSDFPIILKLNGSDYLPLRRGLGPEELADIAVAMEKEGLDAVEISVGHYESGLPVARGRFWRFFRGMLRSETTLHLAWWRRAGLRVSWPLLALFCNVVWRHREGFNAAYAAHFARRLSIPVISVGGFLTRAGMEEALAEGLCDAVSCARSMIADPFLYRHLRENVTGPRCVFCNACVGVAGSEPVDCYHPEVGRAKERLLALSPAPDDDSANP